MPTEPDRSATPTPGHRRERPRLVTWRAGACFVGFAVAGWIWLGWGCCWGTTAEKLATGRAAPPFPGGWAGRYVRVRATGPEGSFRVDAPATYSRFFSGSYATIDELRVEKWEGEIWPPWEGSYEPLPLGTIVRLHEGDPNSGVYALVAGELEQPCPTVSGRVLRSRVLLRGRWPSVLDNFPGPAELVVDTTAGRVNGVVLIGFVVAFWSAVFLGLHVAHWRRSVARHEALVAEAAE